jgi:hypothetical protein
LTISLAAQEPAGAAAQVRKLEEKWTAAYKERNIDILAAHTAKRVTSRTVQIPRLRWK